jgi:sec-independent protein translocase protein TatA
VFNVGPAEILVILVVALLVLGPTKLPEAARQMGKAMSEFRRVTSGLQDEVRGVLDDHFQADSTAEPIPAPELPEVQHPDDPPPVDPTAN